jgi:hypothetical protein
MRHPSEPADSPPGEESNAREAQELSKLVGLDAGSESPAEEIAGETPKLPKQSENVIDNKGSAAEGSATEGVRLSGRELPTDVPELQREDAKSQVQR